MALRKSVRNIKLTENWHVNRELLDICLQIVLFEPSADRHPLHSLCCQILLESQERVYAGCFLRKLTNYNFELKKRESLGENNIEKVMLFKCAIN